MKMINEEALPLAGVKVVEFCSIAAGPFCGMLLSDLGAEVIKIEPPQGDAMRYWPPLANGFSESFASLNRNKRSVVLDLKDKTDNDIAKELISKADVLIENNRPGVMERLGLDFSAVSKLNDSIVYCSISAFGQNGPRSSQAGFDLTIQAGAGVMSVTGEDGGRPVKCGVPISDFSAGLYAAFVISSMLPVAKETRKSQYIDVPMLGCTLGIAALQTAGYFGSGISPERMGSAHPRNSPYQAYLASDDYFVIAAGTQKLWKTLCVAIQRQDLLEDSRFHTIEDRAKNQLDLTEILNRHFKKQDVMYWLDLFDSVGVPSSKINDYQEALADPQVKFMEWVQNIALPNGEKTKSFGFPVRINNHPITVRNGPPELGDCTDQIVNTANL